MTLPAQTDRKYQPIWTKLKHSHSCRITAPIPLHRRIIKAVAKEKNQDLEYKFLLSERGKRATLSFKRSGSILEFNLAVSLGVEDL